MALESSSSGSTQSAAWIGPTSPGDRIVALDVLRGFALLGILLINIRGFSGVENVGQEWTGFADIAVQEFLQFFARGKFFTIFAMLFGIGFAMQIARLEQKTGHYFWIYGRRLLVLFLFGMAHLVLASDVVSRYAICGALLLLFRRVSSKALLLWALLLMPLPYLHTVIVSTLATAESPSQVLEETEQSELRTNQQVEADNDDTDSDFGWFLYGGETARRVYSEGDLSEVLTYNIQFAVNRSTSWISYLWDILGPLPVMLVGLFIGRRRILERIHDELPLLRKVFWLGLGVGIAGTWFSQVLDGWNAMTVWNPWVWFASTILFFALGAWSMALSYGAGIVLLIQRDFWNKCLTPLQAVGRLALTNYLLQTLICTTLFYSYGLGLYGKLGPADLAFLAIGIYLFQVALSLLWTRRFRFGPVEWLWRSLTYGRIQPMRITQSPRYF